MLDFEKEFEERLSKGLKIIEDYFEEHWGSDIHLKYAKGIFDIWAVSEAKRYECINTKGTYFKQMSKNEKTKALEFNDLLEQEFKDYAKELVKEYQKKYPIEESKKSARKSIKESINYEVEGLYFFNFDVGETCSVDLKDAFNADGVISEFYKNENRIYSIVICSTIDYYFFISYDYRKKKVTYSECFSSYQNAKNTMRDWLKNI